MRMSKLFSQTLRDNPVEAEVASHQLLLRAGFIRQVAAGIFTFLPLGRRVMDKIAAILRQEIEAIGGQEISMPVVNPATIWKESGRWYSIDAEMGRFKDRMGRDMALAMTHEEALSDLVRKELRSYRQLPALLYHIQTKWRDDPRPRAGLIRAREFSMKDSYSLDANEAGLDRQYQAHYEAYFRIFERCGLPAVSVGADTGAMGGSMAHEFMYLTPIGEDTLILCDGCGYAANRQVARFRKPQPETEAALALEKVATPGAQTIAALAEFLGLPASRTAKAVFLVAELPNPTRALGPGGQPAPNEEVFVFAIVRGDMEVNETKLAQTLRARALRPATEDEIRAAGAAPGYASPVGLGGNRGPGESRGLPVRVIVDDLIPASPNLVTGANEEGFHLLHVNYGRDYTAQVVADIVAAQEGDNCVDCGQPLRAVRGVELGNIFKLGTYYSEPMGCTFNDHDGLEKPVFMGSYGIGLGRLLACIAEEHHDEHGLKWPASVAPYSVHLVALTGKTGDPSTATLADQLYSDLQAAGIEVLYDDREESPGIKFNDADLIGLPVRLTVSTRALKNGGIEFKRRDSDERVVIPTEAVIPAVQRVLT